MTITVDTSTLTQNALAVLQPGFTGRTPPDWLLHRLDEGLASVGLFGRNVRDAEQLAALTERLREVRPDVLVAIDEEGGDVTRLEVGAGSSFPGNLALGMVDDAALTRGVARELGRRLAECGVDLDWAPSADINSNPENPVIGVRSFGSDPQLVARHTVAYIEGLQAAGVAACVKHFPGHGDTAVDSHYAVPRVEADLDTLRRRELVPFRAAIEAGVKCVMSAHLLSPALDAERPGTLSPDVLTGLLRTPQEEGGLGHRGLVVTDGIEMKAISAEYGLERGSVLALAAGADAICVGGGLADEETVLRLRDALVNAVREGALAEERLADAAARVRELTAWTREAARTPLPEPDGEIGLRAARRALTVSGLDGYRPPEAPFVASFTPLANIAVGDQTPWGPAAELSRLLPETATATYGARDADAGPEELSARVLREAGGRRVVAVVRDVHRHPWMARTLQGILTAREETVVVEMGVPQAPPTGALYLATHGASRVCGRAAAEIIAGGSRAR